MNSNEWTVLFLMVVVLLLVWLAGCSGSVDSFGESTPEVIDGAETGPDGEALPPQDNVTEATPPQNDGSTPPQTEPSTPGAPSCLNPPQTALLDATTYAECCPGAHCVSTDTIPPEHLDDFGDCDGGLGRCVPAPFIEFGWLYEAPTCSTEEGAEGRCLSPCIPSVAFLAQSLSRADCGAIGVCMPCCDPATGAPTGACELACDEGPALACSGTAEPPDDPYEPPDDPYEPPDDPYEPPDDPGYPQGGSCCAGLGECVPAGQVPAGLDSVLQSCEGGELCLPDSLESGNSPVSCAGSDPLFGTDYQGVCLPTCLELNLLFELPLDVATCGTGAQCVPCTDPWMGVPLGTPGCG